jgi:hypothetical protein
MLTYRLALTAALEGDETELERALGELDQSELSRLRNALHDMAEKAEARRKILWRNR